MKRMFTEKEINWIEMQGKEVGLFVLNNTDNHCVIKEKYNSKKYVVSYGVDSEEAIFKRPDIYAYFSQVKTQLRRQMISWIETALCNKWPFKK